MAALSLYLSVPVAAFRAPYAREYLETLPCPPPATVYGMLLSLVGETDRRSHIGAEIALGMLSTPAVSTVIRTVWRLKTGAPPGTASNKRPDFQQILTDVRLVIWLRAGSGEPVNPSLEERVRAVIDKEAISVRFGALALGESTHLVDEIRRLRADDGDRLRLLRADTHGHLALPIWVDHVGSARTRWMQFSLVDGELPEEPPADAWVAIGPRS